MKNRMKNKLSLAALAAAVVLMAGATSSHAATIIASFDVGQGTVQSGFAGINADGAVSQNLITATFSGLTDGRDRGTGSVTSLVGNPQADLLKDFRFSALISVTLSGLAANTAYDITWYQIDAGGSPVSTKLYKGSTSGTFLGEYAWTSGNASTAAVALNLSSDVDGKITIVGTNGTSTYGVINGLTVATVPEPSAALLGGLGALMLLRRRR